MAGILYGIGVGPGDPELITLKAKRLINDSDVLAYPAPETIPSEGLLEGLAKGLEREGQDLAYYPDPFGSLELRELVKNKLKKDRKIDTSIEEILITHGSGEANNLVIQNLTDPGDTVITEEYVYLGTLSQLNKAEANIVGAKMDDEGIIPQELDKLIKELINEGKKLNIFTQYLNFKILLDQLCHYKEEKRF